MKDDRHKDAIPEAVLTQVYGQTEAVKTALAPPYALALTPQERHDMLKMGDRRLALLERKHDYARDNPALVPSFLDIDDFDKDFSDARGLWSLLTEIQQLEETVSDTIMEAGSEACHAALAGCHNVQAAAKQSIPGAKVVYENLKPHLPGTRNGAAGPMPERTKPFPPDAPRDPKDTHKDPAETLFQSPPMLKECPLTPGRERRILNEAETIILMEQFI